jgi:hypothetical protein
MNIAARFADPSVQKSAAVNLALIDRLEELIGELELYLTRTAKVDDVQTYHRLRTIPGVGPVLALVLLYEMHDAQRFDNAGQFLSYARLVRPLYARVGRQEARLWRQEDRQCPPALGLRRGGVSVSARQRPGQEVEANTGGTARRRQSLGHPGGAPGPGGVPHAAQERSLRRGAFLGRHGANRYGFLFSVPQASKPWAPLRRLSAASVWVGSGPQGALR